MIIKQIIRDLRKEWSWVLFYVIVSTMTVIAVFYLTLSFSIVKRNARGMQSFIDQKVTLFEEEMLPLQPKDEEALHQATHEQAPTQLISVLQQFFSQSGHAGSFLFVGNEGKENPEYDQILILLGQYAELTGLRDNEETVLFVPDTHKEDVGKMISVAGSSFRIAGSFSHDYLLFHPSYSFDGRDLSNTLILCTKDFQTVNDMFPWWNLQREVFRRMVLVDPVTEEVETIENLYYKHFGTLCRGISTERYARVSMDASIRGYKMYLLFYVLSGILLLIFFICNMIRVMETHMRDYTIHHLYGATVRTIMWRVGGFIFVVHLPLLSVILWMILLSEKTLWYVFPLSFLATLGICFFAAEYVAKRIGMMNALNNLRRDY